jgi:hypothetical protein
MAILSDAALGVLAAAISVIGLILKSYLEKKDKGQLETAKESADINNLIHLFEKETNSSSIFILGYHNGGKLYNHQSRQKCTMIYGFGLIKPMQDYRDVPIGFFSSMLLALHEKGSIKHNNINNNISSGHETEDSYFINDYRYRDIMKKEFSCNAHYAFSFYANVYKPRLHIIPVKKEKVVTFSLHFMKKEGEFDNHEEAEMEVCLSKIKTMLD